MEHKIGVASNAQSQLDGLQRLHLIMGVQCNVRCTMCYQTDFSPKFNMPAVLYKERLLDAYPHVRTVKLQGGEPTIMKNCRETATLLRDYPNVKLSVTTNGVNIDEFWHETFQHQGALVWVSINAATEAAYDKIVILGQFQKVIKNIERVLANRKENTPAVRISTVILKENFHETAKLLELGEKLGVDGVDYIVDPILSFAGLPNHETVVAELRRCHEIRERSGMHVTGLTEFQSKFLFRFPQYSKALVMETPAPKPMCGAPFHNVVVDWNGDVRTCCNSWVDLGNLHRQTLTEIWRGERVNTFRRKMEKNNYIWCAPNCDDNANPTKLALAHKYTYQLREDPGQFVRKVDQKARQLVGKWVKVKPKKKAAPNPVDGPPSTPPTTRGGDGRVYLPVLNNASSAPPVRVER
jgi:sulfatase maturation enzyme AslB (radical SAM superfamily)